MPQIMVPLTIRDLAAPDLASCAWAGLGSGLITELERAGRGDADYLVVCPPSGLPVALGGVDYAVNRRAGTLYQLTVHGALQSCGIGTILIGAAEARIRGRGLRRSELAVEEKNIRARALYERLGYAAYASRPEAWLDEAPDGSRFRYETVCTLMRKDLR
jgi:ribosomal protein S18 acetylase RimI-like enzyme